MRAVEGSIQINPWQDVVGYNCSGSRTIKVKPFNDLLFAVCFN